MLGHDKRMPGFQFETMATEVVICMFAWQCDGVISGDNVHRTRSGTALPKPIKWAGGRGVGKSTLLLKGSCIRN